MDKAINITVEVLSDNDIEEYSKLMVAVMEEFNQEGINGFQYWFTSVEGIDSRRRWSYDDDYDMVQFAAKYNNEIIGALEIESKDLIQWTCSATLLVASQVLQNTAYFADFSGSCSETEVSEQL